MIIKSLLDLDYYKLTMMQFAFVYYKDLEVEYKFTNRKKDIMLSSIIDEPSLRNEIEHIKSLKFTEEELEWVSKQQHRYEENGPFENTFREDFIEYLRNFEMSDISFSTDERGEYDIRPKGTWMDAILWETLLLSTINEAYYMSKYQQRGKYIEQGTNILFQHISKLNEIGDIPFIDFGTRRRFSYEWQSNVLDILNSSVSQDSFMGTSNCKMAMDKDIPVSGTNAHELYMLSSGIYREDMVDGHRIILNEWWKLYGYDMSIALTDTFGTDFFFKNFGYDNAVKWKGFRHDSGCPFEFGNRVIKYYEDLGIDCSNKLVVFSDGLDIELIVKLYQRFKGKFRMGFGWGTKLTNNVGLETLSIVIKVYKITKLDGKDIDNIYLVKLSDNVNKNMGRDEELEIYKEVFDYSPKSNSHLDV